MASILGDVNELGTLPREERPEHAWH